jgi:predicted  nucleic acid-binding Zn-ribbon protein
MPLYLLVLLLDRAVKESMLRVEDRAVEAEVEVGLALVLAAQMQDKQEADHQRETNVNANTNTDTHTDTDVAIPRDEPVAATATAAVAVEVDLANQADTEIGGIEVITIVLDEMGQKGHGYLTLQEPDDIFIASWYGY